MSVKRIDPNQLVVRPFELIETEWALLVSGTERPNPMTVGWGGLGTLWRKPVATIYVRPTRHSFSLLEAHPEFTLNFLPKKHHGALEICGSVSGRDKDKWKETGLHPLASDQVQTPRVAEAHLSLECRVLASEDFDPKRFLDAEIEALYPSSDYHRIYFGEVLAVWAGDSFIAR